MLVSAARRVDQVQGGLRPPALVSVFDEMPSEVAVNPFVPELLFQMPISPGSLPSACFLRRGLRGSLFRGVIIPK